MYRPDESVVLSTVNPAPLITAFRDKPFPHTELTVTNPMDVETPAAFIIDRVVAIRQADPNAKIIVNCGEDHPMPTHKLIPAAVLSGLHARNMSIAFADEWPHDFLLTIANEHFGMDIPADQLDHLNSRDLKGHQALQGSLYYCSYLYAPQTQHALCQLCLDRDIPAIFNDAARIHRNDTSYLNPVDPLTLAETGDREDIKVLSPEGVAIRNKIMFMLQIKALKTYDIIVQSMGAAHLYGDKEESFLNEDSLSGLFSSLAQSTGQPNLYQINIFPVSHLYKPGIIPQNVQTSPRQQHVIMDDLSSENFYSYSSGETDFIDAVITQSGHFMDHTPFTSGMKAEYYEQVKAFFESLPPEFPRKKPLWKRVLGF